MPLSGLHNLREMKALHEDAPSFAPLFIRLRNK